MKKYILLGSSILLIIISISIFITKRITPVKENKEFLKQQQEAVNKYNAAVQKIQEDEKKNFDELNSTDLEKIPTPKNDEERVGLSVGTFFSYINNKEYDKAYAILYDNYKEINFPTYEEFEEYCKDTYKDYKILKYIKYERNNELLITEVTVRSATGKTDNFNQVFSIMEVSNGVFKLSIGL